MESTPAPKNQAAIAAVAALFCVSGFCSLLYQTVWLRLALARFGVVAPVVSAVVSVFMLGLALGSWGGGKYVTANRTKMRRSALLLYGLCELTIGIGAILVPLTFSAGENLLLNVSAADSLAYLTMSAIAIAVSILPWATAIGATFPFGLAFLEELDPQISKFGFGFLYVANVAGAALGTLLTVLVLIEVAGLSRCLWLGTILNVAIAGGAITWALKRGSCYSQSPVAAVTENQEQRNWKLTGIVLFTTGLVSMAMEVVWIRAFTPIIGPVVYSFALLLAVYLISTCIGSLLYRQHLRRDAVASKESLLGWSACFALLPLVLNDPHSPLPSVSTALLSITPFSAALGYLTPLLIDEVSLGNPKAAGRAYAMNVVGGILGPLLAGYLLLPTIGVKYCLIVLSIPLLLLTLAALSLRHSKGGFASAAVATIVLIISFNCLSWEEIFAKLGTNPLVNRDYAATTIAYVRDGYKILMVNGIGMTSICSQTKFMAHLPLSSLVHQPKSALAICFGVGTTFRSLLSWGIDVTAVELVPGVKRSFPYFWQNAQEALDNPHGQIIVDDGRRYLKRVRDKYDLITIDPPPPVEAAGSSLLYSQQFYAVAKEHLRTDGILAQWYPAKLTSDEAVLHAVARSLHESFPYIKVYKDIRGLGYYFLCSASAIADLTAEQMWQKMSPAARLDFEDDTAGQASAAKQKDIAQELANQLSINQLLVDDPNVIITDDRPFNEYNWVRHGFK